MPRFDKQLRVEEILIRLTGLVTKAGQVWELLKCDCVRYLQPEDKIVGRLVDHAFQILSAGEIVIRGIDANCFNDLGVFCETVAIEPGLTEEQGVGSATHDMSRPQ